MPDPNVFQIREYLKDYQGGAYKSFVVGADIGGTNTNLMLAEDGDAPEMVASWHVPTRSYHNLTEPLSRMVHEAQTRYGARPGSIAIAAAGPVVGHLRCKLTNAPVEVDAGEIEKALGVSCVVINDFEAIGFSINLLSGRYQESLVELKRDHATHPEPRGVRAALGAGTGLGKSILFHDRSMRFYVPAPSEGGHTDFAPQNGQEWEMAQFAREKLQRDQVFYEDFLSGRGLVNIYEFLRQQGTESPSANEIEAAPDKAAAISKCSRSDEACREASQTFVTIYARCARNLSLDTLARGGLYIAGGIAARNADWFTDGRFVNEYEHHATYPHILRDIPVYLITNYDTGMYGAVFAASKAAQLKEWWG